jgi:hypothetical protein
MRYIFMTALGVLMLAASPASAENRAAILKDNMEMARLLEDIAAPVLVKNPNLCGSYTKPYLGVEFMTRAGVGQSYQDLVTKNYGVGEFPTVTFVGKGSPADGNLLPKDVITNVNGLNLKKGNDGQYALEDEIAKGTALNLTLERAGAQKTVSVTPAKVCGAKVRLDASDENKVWADKGKVFVSKGALRGQSPETLAAEIKAQLSRYKK